MALSLSSPGLVHQLFSSQRITFIPWKRAVDLQYLPPLGHLRGPHERYRTWDGGRQLRRGFVRVNDSGSAGRFRPENLGDPVLPELRFRHLINSLQHHFAFAGTGSAHQQGHLEVRRPELPVAQHQSTQLGESQIVHRNIGPHHHREIAFPHRRAPPTPPPPLPPPHPPPSTRHSL